MSVTRFLQSLFLFAFLALLVDSAFGEATDTRSDDRGTGESDVATSDVGRVPLSHHEGEEGAESDRPGKGSSKGGKNKGTFSDSDGTGWNYCSGKCSMRNEKIARAGGGTDNVLRIKKGNCSCGCVLFNSAGPKLVKKIEVTEDSGYFNIGKDSPKNYSLRCCEED